MAAITSAINAFLPFTNPATPIYRDFIHTLVLCTFLYFAPQIPWHRLAETFQRWSAPKGVYTSGDSPGLVQDPTWPAREDEQDIVGADNEEELGAQINRGEDEGADHEEQPQQERFNLDPAAALNLNDDEAPAGPADPPRAPRNTGVVGAKKAKALARRDRVRAYNEFLRAQGDEQRRMDAEGQEEREAELQRERERRAKAERKIEEAKVKEREERKARIEKEQAQERKCIMAVREAVGDSSKKVVDLNVLAKSAGRSVDWMVDVVRKEEVLGFKKAIEGGTTMVMITKSGHLVRIDAETMRSVYTRAAHSLDEKEQEGKVTWSQMGGLLARGLQAV